MPGAELPTFGAALLLGLFGSVHCVGMCGGIVAALAAAGSPPGAPGAARPFDPLLYNGARIASYALVGALAGALGAGLGALVGPEGIAALRIALGLLLLLIGAHLVGIWPALAALERLGLAVWRRVAPLARGVGGRGRALRLLTLGALWGWLPCGLVYAAAAGAAVAGSAGRGALVMLGFGVGTLPTLLASGAAATALHRLTARSGARAVAGVFVAIAGLWTIAGALGVGAHLHP